MLPPTDAWWVQTLAQIRNHHSPDGVAGAGLLSALCTPLWTTSEVPSTYKQALFSDSEMYESSLGRPKQGRKKKGQMYGESESNEVCALSFEFAWVCVCVWVCVKLARSLYSRQYKHTHTHTLSNYSYKCRSLQLRHTLLRHVWTQRSSKVFVQSQCTHWVRERAGREDTKMASCKIMVQ